MTKKLMTADREIELIRRRDDKKALDELVLANLGLVHKIVHKFPIKNSSCNYEDLFQEGVGGLIHGIQKFDSTRGYRLSTYVYRWIQAYVSRYYQNHGRVIRIPVHMYSKQLELNKKLEEMTKELGRTPTPEEIEHLDVDADIIRSSMEYVGSLNKMISESDELECLQGEDHSESFDTQMDCHILLSKVRQEVSDRDFQIIVQRYGLCGENPHTLNEIALKNGITRARCHQIEKQLLQRMKELSVA